MKAKPSTVNKNVYAVCGASKLTLDLNTVSGMYVDNGHIIIVFDNGFRYKADEIAFETIKTSMKFFK